jgi:TRAP-type C4-dicarboxylate transport system permease small subunit
MFTRAAKYIDKVVSYPSNLLSAMAMVAIVVTMLAVVADVLGRWLFRSPVRGTNDIVTMAFALIVWGPMALAAFKGSHIAMTFLLDRFPRLPRLVFELIINLVTGGVLGIVSWRLVMYGISLGEAITRTGVLKIPVSPFVYFAAFGCVLMALIYLARVPETVGKIRREPEAVEKIQKAPEAVEKIEKMKGSGL